MKKLLLATALLASCGTEQSSDLDIVGGQKVIRNWVGKISGCTASLINSRWAISASHCFNRTPKAIKFKSETIGVKRIVKHPSRDLALIELERRSKIKPVKLGNGKPQDGDKLRAFGYGQTSHPGNASSDLMGAVFRFNAKATDKARPGIIRASAPGKAICFGDSGGPVMFNGLIATNTFTVGNCQPGGLMGFTRVDTNWVRRYVK